MIGSAPLPFTLYPLPAGTSLSAHFARGQDRCGVYVLTHEDGSKYVGRALDVVRRCADHVRHAGHMDITRELIDGRTGAHPSPSA